MSLSNGDIPTITASTDGGHQPVRHARFKVEPVQLIAEPMRANPAKPEPVDNQHSVTKENRTLLHMNHSVEAANGKESGKHHPKVSMNEIVGYFVGQYKSHEGKIRLNCFLFVLLGIILTAMFIFVAMNPDHRNKFEISITDFATFWPLERRLSLYGQWDSLEIKWGDHDPLPNQYPYYCDEDASKECKEGHCCLRYPDHSRMTLHAFTFKTAKCMNLNWKSSSRAVVFFRDCVDINTHRRKWYGGAMTQGSVSWPRDWALDQPFSVLTGDLDRWNRSQEPTGVVEPFIMSNDSYAMWIRSSTVLLANSTDTQFCVRAKDQLQYTVCVADDIRDLYYVRFRNKQSKDSNETSAMSDGFDKIFLKLDLLENVMNTTKTLCSAIRNFQARFKPQFVVNFINVNLFDSATSVSLSDMIDFFTQESNLPTAVEVSSLLNTSAILRHKELRQYLVWLKNIDFDNKRSTALVKWRHFLWNIIDFTRQDIRDWFLNYIENAWSVYEKVDYFTLAAGAATLIPNSADLYVTSENANFYTENFVTTLANFSKSVLTPVGFNTAKFDGLFVSVPVSAESVLLVIPRALTFSIMGYGMMTLDIMDLPEITNDDHPPFKSIVELAMFFPNFRMPATIFLCDNVLSITHACAGLNMFTSVWNMFGSLRDSIVLPHYELAFEEFKKNGTPVIRPMWWTEEGSKFRGQTTEINNQFMIGNDLVVAAFLEHSHVQNRVYLPRGVWRDPVWKGGVITIDQGQFVIYASNSDISCFVRV